MLKTEYKLTFKDCAFQLMVLEFYMLFLKTQRHFCCFPLFLKKFWELRGWARSLETSNPKRNNKEKHLVSRWLIKVIRIRMNDWDGNGFDIKINQHDWFKMCCVFLRNSCSRAAWGVAGTCVVNIMYLVMYNIVCIIQQLISLIWNLYDLWK